MKALPLWQPWATLVAVGAKRVETRHFPPDRIGLAVGQRIAIYATKGLGNPRQGGLTQDEFVDLCASSPFRERLADGGYHSPAILPRGAIVCTCRIARASVMTTESIRALEQRNPTELAFGHYVERRFAWVLDDVRRLEPPVVPPPTGSRQGTFDWQPDDAMRNSVPAAEPAQGTLL